MALSTKMRIYHRYLGFFLAGIMAMYAISGVVLIFRNTDFLKNVKQHEKSIKVPVTPEALGKEIKVRDLKIDRIEGSTWIFKSGSFDTLTGNVKYTTKELPYVLDKFTKLHKANTNDPLYYLNIFFGLSLLFFVLSSFWMFMPKTTIFKKGLYYTIAGIILTLVLLFV